jgi:hypothetical protein
MLNPGRPLRDMEVGKDFPTGSFTAYRADKRVEMPTVGCFSLDSVVAWQSFDRLNSKGIRWSHSEHSDGRIVVRLLLQIQVPSSIWGLLEC